MWFHDIHHKKPILLRGLLSVIDTTASLALSVDSEGPTPKALEIGNSALGMALWHGKAAGA